MQNMLIKQLTKWLPKTRKSNPWSKLVRPWLEKSWLGKSMAAQVMMVMVITNIWVPSSHAFDYPVLSSDYLDASEETVVKTQRSWEYPVVEPIGVSQGYYALHRGIDIRAPKGSEVVSVASGVVIEVEQLRYGYGNHIRIAHMGTISSLYAHLDQVVVEVGDKVEKGQLIGTIGVSGWSTGPHLHFEISEAERELNPGEFISQ